jgi:ribosomal protein L16 Arg81 hydroxylase
MLYIPRGWAHVATPVDEPSLHLTIAVRPPNGIDFLRWLVDELGDDSGLRADFPRVGTPADLEGFMDRIRTHVADRIGMEAARRFFLSWEAEQAARPLFNLPDCGQNLDGASLADEALLRLAGQRRLPSIAGDDPGEQLIIADDREWPCRPAVAERLARLSSATDIRFGALREGLSADETRALRTLLTGLIRVGAVFVRQ